MSSLTRNDVIRLVESGDAVLLEALPPEHYGTAHLPGAHNLPLDDLEHLAPDLVPDKGATIVTYCTGTTCSNSQVAADRLRALGYTDVRAYEGGKEDWQAAGLPVESSGMPPTP